MKTLLALLLLTSACFAYNDGGSYPDTLDKPLTPVGSQYKPDYWDGKVDQHVLNMEDVEADKTVHVRKARPVIKQDDREERIKALENKVKELKNALTEAEAKIPQEMVLVGYEKKDNVFEWATVNPTLENMVSE